MFLLPLDRQIQRLVLLAESDGDMMIPFEQAWFGAGQTPTHIFYT